MDGLVENKDLLDTILNVITDVTGIPEGELLDEGATFTSLHINPVEKEEIAIDLEYEYSVSIESKVSEEWDSVLDVYQTVDEKLRTP